MKLQNIPSVSIVLQVPNVGCKLFSSSVCSHGDVSFFTIINLVTLELSDYEIADT